jgi:uncharacterized protein
MKNLLLLLLLFSGLTAFSQKKDTGKKHKVVIQFVTADTTAQQSLLNNLRNLKDAWPESQIEVVFHGSGINMMQTSKTKHAKDLQDFSEKKGVALVVCENTMRQRNVSKDMLLPFAGTVPTGVGEVILKQEKGWSYLKGGL